VTSSTGVCLQCEIKRSNIAEELRGFGHVKRERTVGAEVDECEGNLGGLSRIKGHKRVVGFGSERHNVRDKADGTSAHVSNEIKTHEENSGIATVGREGC